MMNYRKSNMGNNLTDVIGLFFGTALVLCILCLGLFFIGTILGLPKYFEERDARNWSKTQGTLIEYSFREKEVGIRGVNVTRWGQTIVPGYTRVLTCVTYRYTIDNKEYIGYRKNISEGDTRFYVQHWKEAELFYGIKPPYQPNQKIDVYYNPKKPKQCVLEHSLPVFPWPLVICPFGIAIGLFFFFALFYPTFRSNFPLSKKSIKLKKVSFHNSVRKSKSRHKKFRQV